MTNESPSLVGIGLYSPAEAARLLKIPGRTLRRWIDGYTFRTRGEERFSPPVVRAQLEDAHTIGVVTFRDLMELRFVAMFRQAGVSLPVIRAAANRAAQILQVDHPFAAEQFRTDGSGIFAWLRRRPVPVKGVPTQRVLEQLDKCQLVFAEVAEPFFSRLEFGLDRVAERFWPLGQDGRVVLDPQRAFGKPIDEPTGVPTFTLYQASLSGDAEHRIAAWYKVPVEAIRQSVRYEESLLQA